MTPIADMIEQMLSSGATIETALVAVRAFERHAVTSQVTHAVTLGAIRTRRWRQNLKQNQGGAKANDVAATPSPERHNERHAVTQRCDLSSTSLSGLTSEVKEVGSKKEVVQRARGTRLSPDAVLSDAGRQFARGLLEIDQAWAEFRDYWAALPGQRGLKLDWEATWRNRVRQLKSRLNGKSHGPGNVIAAADRLVERVRALDAPAPSAIRDGTSPSDVRLLSKG